MMKLVVITVAVLVVCSAQDYCLDCCGKSPCCNTCGLDANVFTPLRSIRRAVVDPSLADLLHGGGINVMCPECCGPKPCCSTCGLDFNNLKSLLAIAEPVAK